MAKNVKTLSDKAILCQTNYATSDINDEIVNRLEGTSKTYLSFDTVKSDGERLDYYVKDLNSLTLSRLLLHELTPKKAVL